MKSLYLFCAGLLLAATALAQRNYVSAALLLQNGDSLSGQIDYRKWDVNPLSVSFREGNDAAAREYAPADIKGFLIRGNQEMYLSMPAAIDVTQETVDHLSATQHRDSIGGVHFLRVLMDGPVKLLLYTDRFHRQHFFIMEKDSLTALIKKQVYISNQESVGYGQLKTHHFYRQQLAGVFGDCVPARHLSVLDYSERALRSVLQQYAGCRYPGQQLVTRKEDRDTRVSLGLMGGAGLNTYRFSGSHPFAPRKYGNTVAPVVGIFLDVPVSRYRQKISWNNELIYTTRAFSSSWSSNGFYNEVDVQFHYIQVQTLLKYTLPQGSLRPYVNVGVAAAISLGGRDEFRAKRESGTASEELQPALEGGKKFLMPLLAGAGLRYKRLHTELRVVLPHNLSEFLKLKAMVITPQLLVRYALF